MKGIRLTPAEMKSIPRDQLEAAAKKSGVKLPKPRKSSRTAAFKDTPPGWFYCPKKCWAGSENTPCPVCGHESKASEAREVGRSG